MLHGMGGTPDSITAAALDGLDEPAHLILPTGKNTYGSNPAWWLERAASDDQEQLAAEMEWTVDDFAPFLEALTAAYGYKPIVAGHSQGGMLAAAIASRRPDAARIAIVGSGWVPQSMWNPTVAAGEILAVHGDLDETVPYERTLAWAEFVDDAAPVSLYTVPGAAHPITGDLRTAFNDALSAAVAQSQTELGLEIEEPVAPTVTGLYSAAPYPPPDLPAQPDRVVRLATRAEEVSGIVGLRDFLITKAYIESRFHPDAINREGDGHNAGLLLCCSAMNASRFTGNPWAPSFALPRVPLGSRECYQACVDDPKLERWAYSGGLLGMMTATALSLDPASFDMDPARVFDAPFAMAFGAELVRDLHINRGGETFNDLAAGWKFPSWADPDTNAEERPLVIGRFNNRFDQLREQFDLNPNTPTRAVHTGSYPGFLAVLAALLEEDGRTSG
jgi:predicted esterase